MFYLGKLKYIYTSLVAITFILRQDTVYSIVIFDFFNFFFFPLGGGVVGTEEIAENIIYFYSNTLNELHSIPSLL